MYVYDGIYNSQKTGELNKNNTLSQKNHIISTRSEAIANEPLKERANPHI